ncbi:hypothetical protein [Natronosalvus halobius]|uniref:hypothetical protein n=1 Tax=Natronosalvus halobius TaxID=2953746 RepID=UPI0020A0F1F6|nr:hypothetical protein [Natronosalvus halobius]USZ72342.1 hypothetical protein NGM15_03255 [Natronosalvus halobius]
MANTIDVDDRYLTEDFVEEVATRLPQSTAFATLVWPCRLWVSTDVDIEYVATFVAGVVESGPDARYARELDRENAEREI